MIKQEIFQLLLDILQEVRSGNRVGGGGGAILLSTVFILMDITYTIPQDNLIKLVLSLRKWMVS